jgi:N-acetylglucosamine kinase-like BadF-type ATPase
MLIRCSFFILRSSLFILLICTLLHGESPYTLCIDGGGSKTLLQIIDHNARVVFFTKNNAITDATEAPGSNINTVGKDGLRATLQKLFDGIVIDNHDLKKLLPTCDVIAGMAGITNPESKKIVAQVFQEFGIKKEKMMLLPDAELNLQLIEGDGIMLIAGTGSICLGKKNNTVYRVGGLGRILGDEGSGYYIGLQAIKAALAAEYGWGPATSLSTHLKEFFTTPELKKIILPLNLQEISPALIAQIAPLVFQQAHAHDTVAQTIIEQAAHHLSFLITTMIAITHLDGCEVQLWGGVFKSEYADAFIKKIEHYVFRNHTIKIINRARQNPALLFAQKKQFLKN